MKKHIKARRTQYKSHLRRAKHTLDTCGTRNTTIGRIRIPIRYDGYARTEYVKVVYGKTRDTRTHTYISVTNTINEIFPEINAPHNAHTYRGTAPYRKYIPTQGARIRDNEYPHDTKPEPIQTDTRSVKCIIYNRDDEIIYIGMMRRTKTTYWSHPYIEITLHRNDRTMTAYPYIPLDKEIHGVPMAEIRAHGVELYHI